MQSDEKTTRDVYNERSPRTQALILLSVPDVTDWWIENRRKERESVRCGECKHWISDGGAIMFCENTDLPTNKSDYCSWGERRHR